MENIEALVGKESRTKISNVNLNHAALSHDTSNNLSEFKCPTLIMAGRLDPICSMLGTDEMSKSILNSETVVFEKSSHFFFIEEAEKSMTTMVNWFAKLLQTDFRI